MAFEAQFSALGDSVRSKMVTMLQQRPYPVHELAAAFPISRPAISRHLRVLKQAGLVVEVKMGRENLYRLSDIDLPGMSKWLASLKPRPVKLPRKPAHNAIVRAAKAKPAKPVAEVIPNVAPPARKVPKPAASAQPSSFAQMEFEL
jgi:DNA-binding transcriptional ArsR family regulator